MSDRNPILDPQSGDIVRSAIYKNARERHVVRRMDHTVEYIAVSPTCRRTMTCWLRSWADWCAKNKVEIVQRGAQ